MTTSEQDLSRAVDIIAAPSKLIESGIGEFAKVLPSAIDPDTFARWALSVLKNGLNPGGTDAGRKQAQAWARVLAPDNQAGTLSVMAAFMDAASLGLEPGREYHLVPFGDTVTGMTDYRGEIRLITNARESSVICQLVRGGDEFRMLAANIPPHHEPADGNWFGDRGPVVGGYAFTAYARGEFSNIVTMPEAEFLKHREQARTKSVWDAWPEQMRAKTLIHQLRKWVPWARERQW
jgi:hypothetical protein